MSRVVLTPSGHLGQVCSERKRPYGLQLNVLLFCPVDSGAPQRYTQETPADRATEVTDQLVRVNCVGCRLAAAKDPTLVELVARGHGPLEPARGI